MSNALGVYKFLINGFYDATEEESSGDKVYRSQAFCDIWLLRCPTLNAWTIKHTFDKSTAVYLAALLVGVDGMPCWSVSRSVLNGMVGLRNHSRAFKFQTLMKVKDATAREITTENKRVTAADVTFFRSIIVVGRKVTTTAVDCYSNGILNILVLLYLVY